MEPIGPNGVIVIVLSWMFAVTILPIFIFFEAFHWLFRETKVSSPYLKGLIFGFALGLGIAIYNFYGPRRIRLWCSRFFTNYCLGSMISGLMVGLFYKRRGKPLFVRKTKDS